MGMSDVKWIGFSAIKIAVVILFAFFISYKLIYQKALHRKKKFTFKKLLSYSLLGVTIFVILYATLFRESGLNDTPIFIPFSSYKLAWYEGNIAEWRNLILNICMFIPFGFLLPLTVKRLRNPWKVYLSGFIFTLMIETTQLIFKRGIFEADDLINNFLGTLIGYGIYAIASSVYLKKFSKGVIFCQIPLVCVIVAGIVLVCIYNSQEFGNVIYNNVSKHEMPKISVVENIKFEDENAVANTFKVNTFNKEKAYQYVEKIFSSQGKKIDESKTENYDGITVYYSDDNSISVTVEYNVGVISYIKYDSLDSNDNFNCNYLLDLDEEFVRQAVKKIGVEIPEKTIFYLTDNTYTFEKKDDGNDEVYYTFSITCNLNDEGEVVSLSSKITTGELYKSVDIISSKSAFDLVSQGEFYLGEDDFLECNSLTLLEMNFTYICDSKGIYQPAYEFVFDNGSSKKEKIYIMAKEA